MDNRVFIFTYASKNGLKETMRAYGYVLSTETQYGEATLSKIGQIEKATQNKAALLCVIKALERMTRKSTINICVENEYLVNAMNMVETWQQNGWKNAKGKDIANKEEWEKLLGLLEGHTYSFMNEQSHEYRQWLISEVEKEAKKPFDPTKD